MPASVIKEFLVSLGAEINTSSVRQFFVTIEGMTGSVARLVVGVQTASGALKTALLVTASSLESLYYTAQRANSSVQQLKEWRYGLSQIGLSADEASSALESMAMALRLNPGNEGLLRYLGVTTRTANNALRDTVGITNDFIAKMKTMPFFIAAQYAAMFGISDKALNQLLEHYDEVQARQLEWRRTAQAVGLDLDKAGKNAHEFMGEFRALMSTVEALWLKVADVLISRFGPQLKEFRGELLAHAKDITDFGITVGTAITDASEAVLKMLPLINQLVESTVGWRVALEVLADVLLYRILGPLGLAAGLLMRAYQFYKDNVQDDKNLQAMPGGGRGIQGWSLQDIIDGLTTGKAPEWLRNRQEWQGGSLEPVEPEKETPAPRPARPPAQPVIPGKSLEDYWNQLFKRQSFQTPAAAPLGVTPIAYGQMTPQQPGLGGLDDATLLLRVIVQVLRELPAEFARRLYEMVSSYADEVQLPQGRPGTPGVQNASLRVDGAAASPGGGPADPLGIRQNNPGALRRWPGAAQAPNGFAVFRTPMEGLVAMRDNLLSYSQKGLDTIAGIINRWAPPNENNTKAYIEHMARSLGVGPNAKLNMQDPETLAALMRGITMMENGKNPYGSMIDEAARAPLGSGSAASRPGGVTIQQENNFHIQGGDPVSTGKEVQRNQQEVNAGMVRNFRSAVLA